MTTYLLTGPVYETEDAYFSAPFCSPLCVAEYRLDGSRHNSESDELRADDNYEFDESCTNCGALIPASV